MVEKNLSLKILSMLYMTCSLVTVIETTKYANGDKWGGRNGILCWMDDDVPRFLVKESGYKKCSPKTCPWNDLGPFPDVNCQICCHFEEELPSTLSTNNWEKIGKVTLPLSITFFVFLIGLVVGVAVCIIRRRTNKSSGGFEEGSPGSSQESLDMIMTKNKLPKRKRHDSEKSNKNVGEDVEKTPLS